MSSYASSLQSIHSHNSDKDEELPEASSPLVSALEASSKGIVKGSIFLNYFKSSGSLALFVLVVFLFIITQIAASCTDYWVAYWYVLVFFLLSPFFPQPS
jgi:fucose permease